MGFRNLKIRWKLIIGFALMLALAVGIGVSGIVSMKNLQRVDRELYTDNTEPTGYLAELVGLFSDHQASLAYCALFAGRDTAFVQTERETTLRSGEQFEETLAAYKDSIPEKSTQEMAVYKKVEKAYFEDFAAAKTELVAAVQAGDEARLSAAQKNVYYAGMTIADYISEAVALNDTEASGKIAANAEVVENATLLQAGLILAGVVFAVFLTLFIAKTIAPPMRRVMAVAQQAGNTGSLEFPPEMIAAVKGDAQFHDEVGATSQAFAKMVENLIAQAKVLEQIAAGDLTVTVVKAGPQDTLGNAIEAMTNNLNAMFGTVNISTEQVSASSSQIADAAQSLSQGATEQASAVEELSASIEEVLGQTVANSKNANAALTSVNESSRLMGDTVAYMEQMQNAMSSIASSSEEISKIIKVIDDIAFQTNILALNAAVEAARAGQHGKGFAVVADEVRNLASKSAQAAKETSALIQQSLGHVHRGSEIVEKTSSSIDQVATSAQRIQTLVEGIDLASQQQESAISQINTGIEQVSQVVQQNSATAEESAASSQELSAQAQMLKGLVARFRLRAGAAMDLDSTLAPKVSKGPSYLPQAFTQPVYAAREPSEAFMTTGSLSASRYDFPESDAN